MFDCEACRDLGFLVVTVDGSMEIPDGAQVVQKCDACEIIDTDVNAAISAKAEHLLDITIGFPHYASERAIKDFMQIFERRAQ